ncbi:MAG: sulfurtransferase [Pirellulales bacterium]|nr:sulfurtransferase [Pirellulales bacterium]
MFRLNSAIVLIAGLGVLFAQSAKSNDHLGALISSEQLESLLHDPRLCIIDMGPEKTAYDKGHIPGAVYADWIKDISDPAKPERYNLADPASMEKLLSRLGAKNDSCIVIYDDLENRLSTRMYWSLKYYGHQDLHVLDGGRAAWTAHHALSGKAVARPRTQYKIDVSNVQFSADMKYIADHLDAQNVTLVDGRPPAQYSGEEPGRVFHTGTAHRKRGHIPGAVSIFWKDNFNSDGTFKSRAELKKLYAPVLEAETVVTYCNEGLHAAPPWFVLREILGKKDVRVYDDSMSEWANSSQPTELGAAKPAP